MERYPSFGPYQQSWALLNFGYHSSGLAVVEVGLKGLNGCGHGLATRTELLGESLCKHKLQLEKSTRDSTQISGVDPICIL